LNARLAASFTEDLPDGDFGGGLNNRTPLSAMLSKLKESCTTTTPTQQPSSTSAVTIKEESDVVVATDKKKKTKRRKTEESTAANTDGDDGIVPSPDLAMLAAASIRHDNRPTLLHGLTPESDEEKPKITHRSLLYPSSPHLPPDGSFLVQPNVAFKQQQQSHDSFSSSSCTSTQSTPARKMMNGTLSPSPKHHKKKPDKSC